MFWSSLMHLYKIEEREFYQDAKYSIKNKMLPLWPWMEPAHAVVLNYYPKF